MPTILVVHSNESVLAAVHAALSEASDCRIDLFNSTEKAINYAAGKLFDVVISEYNFADPQSRTFQHKMRSQQPQAVRISSRMFDRHLTHADQIRCFVEASLEKTLACA